ncbi:hypothetical protein SCP_1100290 [Sparassis crispa]|uniref:Uncharacterized protein n=1 Tax=Sparassis crispa TaxID=139825 RepID=A0A401GYX1_9APHY|nr:hypothetical protein SCP_1100290 [Sparassis crispa]GBE87354.1 hypothetical protein SCP_1100290 [Sparassis crispa]
MDEGFESMRVKPYWVGEGSWSFIRSLRADGRLGTIQHTTAEGHLHSEASMGRRCCESDLRAIHEIVARCGKLEKVSVEDVE